MPQLRVGKSRLDHLECHGATRILLLGLVYDAHPTRAQDAQNVVAANRAGQSAASARRRGQAFGSPGSLSQGRDCGCGIRRGRTLRALGVHAFSERSGLYSTRFDFWSL